MAEESAGTISIRSIRESDLEAFKALRLEALRVHPDAFGSDYEEDRRRPEEYWIERVKNVVENPYARIFLAETAGELAGMLGVSRHQGAKRKHCGDIWGAYVRAEHRGQRVMGRLIDSAIDWSTANGVRIVNLSVATHNVAALRCYLRCGFTVYGVSPEEMLVDGRYIDELLLFRRL